MTKYVLFDADGVVINSEMFSVQYQKKYRVPNELMLPFFKGDFKKCIIGKADLAKLLTPWMSKWKWKGTVNEFMQFWFKAEHKVDIKVANAIGKLRKRGLKCYLATNQEKYRTEYMKEKMGFDKLFNGIFSSAYIGFKKPSQEYFEHIINKLKANPQEIMYFDDSHGNVDKAKAMGINAHYYSNFTDFKKTIAPLLD